LVLGRTGGGGGPSSPFPPDQPAIDFGDYYGSYAKFHAALGWRPRVPLRDGLARTLAYYAEHLPRYLGEAE